MIQFTFLSLGTMQDLYLYFYVPSYYVLNFVSRPTLLTLSLFTLNLYKFI